MKDTNQLHKENCYTYYGKRIHAKPRSALVTKSGLTTKISESKLNDYFEQLKSSGYQGHVDVVIRFKTEPEGLRKAKSFQRLANNPLIQLNVQFKKVSNDKN
tara:strand:- start:456 stop:761 length:306 start_codon:yes stop_codon:yes gene_type:complete